MTETDPRPRRDEAAHESMARLGEAVRLLRTIRTLLVVWTVVAAVALVAGTLVWVDRVAPY